MTKLTIAVPVYNGMAFLPRLVESLFSQGVDEADFEVLFVNDCSTDDSERYIKDLSLSHSNIRYVAHASNRKLAAACNTALDNAEGEYIWIVDQDDWVSAGSIARLMGLVQSNPVDVLMFNYCRVNMSGETIEAPKVFTDAERTSGKVFLDTYFRDNFDWYLLGYRWRAIFSTRYLSEYSIRFRDGMMYDDTTILLRSIFNARSVISISDVLYFYRVNESSITYRKGKRGERIFEYAFLVGNEIKELAEETSQMDPHFSEILRKSAARRYNTFAIDLMRTSGAERKLFYKMVDGNRPMVKDISAHLDKLSRAFLLPVAGPAISSAASLLYSLKHRA